jgi:PAS domain S-box-containing protein
MNETLKEITISFKEEILFSMSFDIICITDLEGYFIKINNSFENILGYKLEEIKIKKYFDFIHVDYLENT